MHGDRTGRVHAPAHRVALPRRRLEPLRRAERVLRGLTVRRRVTGAGARARDVPVQFLEQLFATLRRAGIISSQRGVKGGYRFARDPADVTVLEVVELLDGPLGRDADGVFADAARAAREVLAATSIAAVIERERSEAGASMYHI